MIEINVKAKGSDPWDTPALTWEQILEKRQLGCLIAYWIYDNDAGLWKLYDNLNPRSEITADTFAKYLLTPAKWQIRAHKTDKVVLVQPVSFQFQPFGLPGLRTYVQHITAPNVENLEEKLEILKASRPNLKILTPNPTWYVVKDAEGAPIAFS